MLSRAMMFACCLALTACSTERGSGELFGPSEAGIPVVDALLIVGRPLPDLFVYEAAGPEADYRRQAFAVREAEVEISQGGTVYRYRSDPDSAGRYLPPLDAPPVRPRTEYALMVRLSGKTVRGVTTTPGPFRLRESVLLDEQTLAIRQRLVSFEDGPDRAFSAPENQVTYLDGLLEARFDRIDTAGYQIGIVGLDRNSERVIDADFLEEDDYEALERHGSSPAFGAPDGTVRLPWFAIYFAGRHVVKIHAVDRNWYDYARSSQENQTGVFGGLAGDSFERPIFHLEGGIGLFGSASVDSVGFVIHPRD